jgi:hypothetical protein
MRLSLARVRALQTEETKETLFIATMQRLYTYTNGWG